MVFYSYGIGIHNNLNANKSSRKTEYWIIFNYNIWFAFKMCLKTNLYIYGNSYFEEFQSVSKRYQSGRRLDCDIIAPWCRGWIRLIAGQRMKSRPGLVREWARESLVSCQLSRQWHLSDSYIRRSPDIPSPTHTSPRLLVLYNLSTSTFHTCLCIPALRWHLGRCWAVAWMYQVQEWWFWNRLYLFQKRNLSS